MLTKSALTPEPLCASRTISAPCPEARNSRPLSTSSLTRFVFRIPGQDEQVQVFQICMEVAFFLRLLTRAITPIRHPNTLRPLPEGSQLPSALRLDSNFPIPSLTITSGSYCPPTPTYPSTGSGTWHLSSPQAPPPLLRLRTRAITPTPHPNTLRPLRQGSQLPPSLRLEPQPPILRRPNSNPLCDQQARVLAGPGLTRLQQVGLVLLLLLPRPVPLAPTGCILAPKGDQTGVQSIRQNTDDRSEAQAEGEPLTECLGNESRRDVPQSETRQESSRFDRIPTNGVRPKPK
ncbi:hypothetical protein LTR50_005138 [Elasticomyces elasticus]|nr:hypothetical protein LTR50_005138 [Elasticomyces elasticus]